MDDVLRLPDVELLEAVDEVSERASRHRPLKRRSQRNDQSPIAQVSFQDMLSSIQSVYSGRPQREVK